MLYSCNEWIKDGNDLYGPTDTEILAKLWFEIIVICSFLHLCHIMMCACGRVYVYGYLLEVDSIVILWIVVLFWLWYEKYAFDSIVSAWCESNTNN